MLKPSLEHLGKLEKDVDELKKKLNDTDKFNSALEKLKAEIVSAKSLFIMKLFTF